MATRFFWPPESWYGARSARSVDVEHRQRVGDPRFGLLARQAHVERAERDLFAHRR